MDELPPLESRSRLKLNRFIQSFHRNLREHTLAPTILGFTPSRTSSRK